MAEHHSRPSDSLLSRVAQALRTRPVRRHLLTEEYGPDGGIVEVREGPLVGPEWPGPVTLAFVPGGVVPKRDWRERGVIPARGFHRYAEREASRRRSEGHD